MKKIALLFSLLQFNFIFSQESLNYIESSIIPDQYIGTIKEVDYYLSRLEIRNGASKIELMGRHGSDIQKATTIELQNDELFLDITAFGESIFLVLSSENKTTKTVMIKEFSYTGIFINKYDILMSELTKEPSEIQVKFENHLIGFFARNTNKTTQKCFVGVFDMVNKEKSIYPVDIENLQDYMCEDFVFNSKRSIDLVLINSYEPSVSIINVRTLTKTLVISCSSSKVSTSNIVTSKEGDYCCKSFKMLAVNEQSYIIGSLYVEHKSPQKLVGYGICQRDFESGETSTFQLIRANDLYKKELWSEKEYGRIQSGKYVQNIYHQKLKKIVSLGLNKVAFMSESQFKNPEGGTIGAPSNSQIGAGSNLTGSVRMNSNPLATGLGSAFNDIIVGAIDISTNNVVWVSKSMGRASLSTPYIYSRLEKPQFITSVDDKKLVFYYACQPASFDDNGKFLPSTKYVPAMKETIGVMEVNIETGAKIIYSLSNNYDKLTKEKPFLFSAKIINGKVESFIAYEWEKAYKFKVDKFRFVDLKN